MAYETITLDTEQAEQVRLTEESHPTDVEAARAQTILGRSP